MSRKEELYSELAELESEVKEGFNANYGLTYSEAQALISSFSGESREILFKYFDAQKEKMKNLLFMSSEPKDRDGYLASYWFVRSVDIIKNDIVSAEANFSEFAERVRRLQEQIDDEEA